MPDCAPYCHAKPDRFLSITDAHLDHAAQLWAQSRNAGTPTSSPEALDADVILVAQALSLNEPFLIATTNTKHLTHFAPAELWSNIIP